MTISKKLPNSIMIESLYQTFMNYWYGTPEPAEPPATDNTCDNFNQREDLICIEDIANDVASCHRKIQHEEHQSRAELQTEFNASCSSLPIETQSLNNQVDPVTIVSNFLAGVMVGEKPKRRKRNRKRRKSQLSFEPPAKRPNYDLKMPINQPRKANH